MSLNMFLGEVNSQTESINQVYADGIEAMQQVIVAIELFYMDGKLQGKTYNSAKTYFKATYRPLAQGMICLCEDLIRLNSAFPEQFQAAVATTDVQEAEVEMQIQQANRHIREAEVLSAVSPTLASSIFIFEAIKRQLQDVLNRLHTFNASSSKMFDSAMDLVEQLSRGLAEIKSGKGWDAKSGTFSTKNLKMAWSKHLAVAWEKRLEQERQEPDTTGRKYVQIEVVSGARIWVWSSDGKTATPEDLQFTEEHNEWKRKYGVKEEKDPTLEQILWDNYMYHAECLRTGVNPETGEELTTLERMQSLSVVLSGVTTLASAAYWGHRWANTNINVNTRTIGNNTIKKNPTNSAGDSSGKNKQGYNRVDSSEKIKNSSNNSVDSKTTNNSTVSEKTGSSSSKNLIGDKGGGSGVNVVKSKTVISPNMKVKILEGQRKVPKNDLIGGHSSKINNVNNDFAVEVLSTNMDGTKNVIFTKQFPDGNISKLKKSTLFPDSWSNEQILNSIIEVGNTPAISTRLRDGATWHRAVVNGVEIDVIKIGDNVTSGYPTGTVNAPRPSGF